MTDRLTTLLHDQATRFDVRLTDPGQLRRGAQHKRVARRSATVVFVVVAMVLTLFAVSNPLLGSTHRTLPVGPPTPPTRFAGLPPAGVQVSLPADGTLVLDIEPQSGAEWNLYADGRIVWQRWTPAGDPQVIPDGADAFQTGYVEQRLTPQGAQLLVSRILAIGQPAGLFRQSLSVGNAAFEQNEQSSWYKVCNNGRLISAQLLPPSYLDPPTQATPAQLRALDQITNLMADSTSTIPANAWADRTIRPFVPSHYQLVWDRSAPDPSKLPSPAREALQAALAHASSAVVGVTTDQARALVTAFAQSGVKVGDGNHARTLEFELPGVSRPTTVLEVRLAPHLPTRGQWPVLRTQATASPRPKPERT